MFTAAEKQQLDLPSAEKQDAFFLRLLYTGTVDEKEWGSSAHGNPYKEPPHVLEGEAYLEEDWYRSNMAKCSIRLQEKWQVKDLSMQLCWVGLDC